MKNKEKNVSFYIVMNAISMIATHLFSFLTIVYISRILSPSYLGRVSFIYYIVSYFTLFSQMGIPVYGVRRCAQCRDDKKELRIVVQELLLVSMILFVAAVVILMITTFAVSKIRAEKPLIMIFAIGMFLQAAGCEWLYKGLEKYTYIAIRNIIFKIIAFVLMFLMVRSEDHYIIYAMLSMLTASGEYAVNFFGLTGYLGKPGIFRTESGSIRVASGISNAFRRHAKPIIVFFMMSCAVSIYANMDMVMLGFMDTDYSVGCYNIVGKVKNVLTTTGMVITGVTMPRASKYWKYGEMEAFHKLIHQMMTFILWVQIPVSVFSFLFAREMVLVIAGKAYLDATLPLQIIVFSIVPIAVSNIIGNQILIPSKHENWLLIGEVAGAVANFILNLILIPKFGMAGAAFTTVLAEVIVCGYTMYYAQKRMQINTLAGSEWYKVLASAMIAAVPAWYMFNRYTFSNNIFLQVMVIGVIYGMCYIVLLFICRYHMLLDFIKKGIMKRG